MTEPIMGCMLAIMEKFEAKMMAKLDICRKKKMDAWLKEMKDV
jgi:hypothetical protein